MESQKSQNTNGYLWKIATLPENIFDLLKKVREKYLQCNLKGMVKPKDKKERKLKKSGTGVSVTMTDSPQTEEAKVSRIFL